MKRVRALPRERRKISAMIIFITLVLIILGTYNPSSSLSTYNPSSLEATDDPRVLIYMTTHWSDEHLKYLPCWEAATRKLKLLRQADLLVFTSGNVTSETSRSFRHFRHWSVQTYSELTVDKGDKKEVESQKQYGAIQAMIRPFQDGWFDAYDWVIRLNPDVLIRRDDWLRQTMADPRIGAIVHNCYGFKNEYKFNTDFTAFRPALLNHAALMDEATNPRDNAEMHLTRAVIASRLVPPENETISGPRIVYLSGVHQKGTACRVMGTQSPVVHHHELHEACPQYFGATDGEWY